MSTTKKRNTQSAALPEEDPTTTALKMMQELMKQLQPVVDLQKAMQLLREDDLLLTWDVRIVQGDNKPLAHIQGTSSMPRALSPNMIAHLASKIDQEITDKIAIPLVGLMQSRILDDDGIKSVLQQRAQQYASNTYHDDGSGTIPDMEEL
ncbi:MAG: hypothetical protein ABIS50_23745 [Luteolibacter sp.]|uniref:hypothetical protein n=1 Tax=Luteolibacter sp. TaxID=1962973 RepID=UPI0032639430